MIKKSNIFLVVLIALLLSGCGESKNGQDSKLTEIIQEGITENVTDENNQQNNRENAAQSFVENKYGFADNMIYGMNITTKETNGTKTISHKKEMIKETSKTGAVYFKEVLSENGNNGLVCVYFSDDENGYAKLEVDYIYDYSNGFSSSYSIGLSNLTENNRCYVIVKDDYLAYVEFSEKPKFSNGDLTYCEKITVYRLMSSGVDEIYTISRELTTGEYELKQFEIKTDTEWIIYAAGYGKFTAEGAEFVTTQQEFCDKANELLQESSIDYLIFNKTSWNNRWFGISIDESGISEDMVKIDFLSSEPVINEKDEEVIDIVVKINDEKQQLAEGEVLEEIEDYPVSYEYDTETTPQETIVMPENIPESVDVNSLQDLRYFDIDGFWYSSDYKYVYHIYTQQPDSGFGTLYFANLKGSAKAKHGQVKQSSSYSVILKAMETNQFSPEVYASNNQLISDELTLIKTDEWITTSLIGTWSDGKRTYTFDSDGSYEVKTSSDWYWGKYFIMGENQIVLGKHLDNLKTYKYSLDGNTLTINNNQFIRQ